MICCSEFLREHPGREPVRRRRATKARADPQRAATASDPDAVSETQCRGARRRSGSIRTKRYLLTICRLMVWKGVDGIDRGPSRELPADVELLVCGRRRHGAGLEGARVRDGPGSSARVHFLGNVPHAADPPLHPRGGRLRAEQRIRGPQPHPARGPRPSARRSSAPACAATRRSSRTGSSGLTGAAQGRRRRCSRALARMLLDPMTYASASPPRAWPVRPPVHARGDLPQGRGGPGRGRGWGASAGGLSGPENLILRLCKLLASGPTARIAG